MGLTDRLKHATEKVSGDKDVEESSANYETIEDNLQQIKDEITGTPKTSVTDLENSSMRRQVEETVADDEDKEQGPKVNSEPKSIKEEQGPDKEELMDEIAELESESGADDETLEELEERITEVEKELMSAETEKLSEIGDLEQRVTQLEVDEQKDEAGFEEFEQRMNRLEAELETLDSPEILDNRLTELEDLVENPERRMNWLIENGLEDRLDLDFDTSGLENRLDSVEDRLEDFQQKLESNEGVQQEEFDQLKTEIVELREKTDSLEEEMRSRLENLEDDSGNVEELWEAMDEEVSMLEKRIEDNKRQNEQLLDQMVQLTELVKDGLR
ncbi:hypothetical protein [Candidatus Nanohalococcus occultus]|uniref:Uncharacterized protein n=1 Tax=Candidatus Nanohalococcus occultus TaxID=2978047 RepID=A0ABY8CFL3_9ARCH|nr:hypothetical protein SVXNc_1001 [Candidatus Nanohaloarchaeota archaeon SVXNc]